MPLEKDFGNRDFNRINRNINQIKEAGLPFSEAVRYLKEKEGVTPEEVRDFNIARKAKQQQPFVKPIEQAKPKVEFEADPTKLTEAFGKLDKEKLKPKKPTKEEIAALEKKFLTPGGALQAQVQDISAIAEVIKPDIKAIKPSFKAGIAVVKRGDVAAKGLLGFESAEETLKKVNEIDKDIPEIKGKGVLSATAELLPFVGQSLGAGAVGGLAGLIGGPGGAVALSRAGAFGSAFAVEGGNTYADLLKQGIDPKVARPIGLAVGAVNGTLEIAQLAILTRLPGGKTLFRKKLVNKLLSDKKAMSAITRFAKDLGAEVGIEGLQESSSQLGDIVGNAIDAVSNDKEYKGPGVKEAFRNVANTLVQSLKGFPLLLLGGRAIGAGVGQLAGETGAVAPELISKPTEAVTPAPAKITPPIEKPTPPVKPAPPIKEIKPTPPIKEEVKPTVPIKEEVKPPAIEEKPKTEAQIKREKQETDIKKVTDERVDIAIKEQETVKIAEEALQRAEPALKIIDVVKKAGGLNITRETALKGELRRLKEGEVKGLVKEKTGQTVDEMREVLEQEALIEPNATPAEVLQTIEEASIGFFKKAERKLPVLPKEAFELSQKEFNKQLKKPTGKLNPIYIDLTKGINKNVFHKISVKSALEKGVQVPTEAVRRYEDLSKEYDVEFKATRLEKLRKQLNNKKEEIKLQRDALVFEFKAREQTADIARSKLIDYIKLRLPLAKRGKFLVAVKRAKNPDTLHKEFDNVEVEANNVYRKQLNDIIKGKLKIALRTRPKTIGFLKQKEIAVEYRNRLRRISDALGFTGKSKKEKEILTSKRVLRKTLTRFASEQNLSMAVVNRMVNLVGRPVRKFTTEELETIMAQVDALSILGKGTYASRKAMFDVEKEARLREIEQGTPKQIKERFSDPDSITKKLTVFNKFKNIPKSMIRWMSNLNRAAMPYAATFNNMFDGYPKNFGSGANYLNLYRPIGDRFDAYVGIRDEFLQPIVELSKKLGILEGSEQAIDIGIHSTNVQPDASDIYEKSGLHEEQLRTVKLKPDEMKLYQTMRDNIRRIHPMIRSISKEYFDKDIGFIPNYFPLNWAYDNMSDDMGERMQRIHARKTVDAKFLETRTGFGKIESFDALKAYRRYIDEVSYFAAMARELKMIGEIVNNKRYKKAVGEEGANIAKFWVTSIASRNKGARKDIEFIRIIRKNLASSILGFRISTIMVQRTAWLDAAARLGGTWVQRGTNAYYLGLTDSQGVKKTSREIRKWIQDNFPRYRERIRTGSASDIDFAKENMSGITEKIRGSGLVGIRATDGLTAGEAVMGAYLKALKKRGLKIDFDNVNREAKNEASEMLELTQGSVYPHSIPAILQGRGLTNNKTLNRSILFLNNFMLFRFQLEKDILNDLSKGRIGDATQKASYTAFAFGFEVALRNFSRFLIGATLSSLGLLIGSDVRRDEKTFTEDFLLQSIGSFPLIGPMIGIGRYGSNLLPELNPIQESIEQFFKLPSAIFFGIGDAGKAARKIGFSVGKLTGLPVGQLEQVTETVLREQSLVNPFSSELRRLEVKFEKRKITRKEARRRVQLKAFKNDLRRWNKVFKNAKSAGRLDAAKRVYNGYKKRVERLK
jgi:hypothetical protein